MPRTKTTAKTGKKTRKVADPAMTPIVKTMPSVTAAPASSASTSQYSFMNFVSFLNNNFSLLLLCGIFFVLGLIVGSLWTEKQLNKTQALNAAANLAPVAQQPDPSGPTEDQLKKVPAVTKDDHIRGKLNAKVVLIEYSDYECPFCNQFHPSIQKIKADYGDDVAWIYRHYPLPFHTHAQKAAEAGECVAKIGGNEAFWKFSDAAFSGVAANGPDTTLSLDGLKQLAIQAGADGNKVMACVDSGEMAEKIKKSLADGSTAGINGTPGTIIIANGKYSLIPGALPYEQVKAQIDAMIK
jgi:protein-disulfide isomerase